MGGRRVTKAMLEEQVALLQRAASAVLVQVQARDEAAVQALPGFVKAEQYANIPPMPGELGVFENLRVITPPPFFDPKAGVAGMRKLQRKGSR